MTLNRIWAASAGVAVAAVMIWTPSIRADYRDLMGFPELQTQLGASIPTGQDIEVTQVEATPKNSSAYMPNTADGELTGKSFINETASSTAASGHATSVAKNFFGRTHSIAPDIGENSSFPIHNYEANDWLNTGYLNLARASLPQTTPSRIANHSWVGSFENDTSAADALKRMDFVVDQDDYIQVAGLPLLSTGGTGILFRDSLNAITVGTPDVNHKTGSVGIATDSTYNDGRIVPNLVAVGWRPDDSTIRTSWAAPMVSAAAALLLENSRNNPGLSLGTVSHTRGSLNRSIQNAETSEVVKATLMAGADRHVVQRGPDITDYTASSANNLDPRFGAGQMNVHTAYNIQAAGEQNSAQDGGSDIGPLGWDYDPSFGGLNDSNAAASYFFDLDQPLELLTATLTWNLDLVGDSGFGPFGATFDATLYDLDLLLIDVDTDTTVADSRSIDENTENLYLTGDALTAGRRYELRVVPGVDQPAFDHDFAIAWRAEVIPEPASVVVGLVGLTLISTRRRLRQH